MTIYIYLFRHTHTTHTHTHTQEKFKTKLFLSKTTPLLIYKYLRHASAPYIELTYFPKQNFYTAKTFIGSCIKWCFQPTLIPKELQACLESFADSKQCKKSNNVEVSKIHLQGSIFLCISFFPSHNFLLQTSPSHNLPLI